MDILDSTDAGTQLDLTASPPLPAPTTTRVLQPRVAAARNTGRARSRASCSISSYSGSASASRAGSAPRSKQGSASGSRGNSVAGLRTESAGDSTDASTYDITLESERHSIALHPRLTTMYDALGAFVEAGPSVAVVSDDTGGSAAGAGEVTSSQASGKRKQEHLDHDGEGGPSKRAKLETVEADTSHLGADTPGWMGSPRSDNSFMNFQNPLDWNTLPSQAEGSGSRAPSNTDAGAGRYSEMDHFASMSPLSPYSDDTGFAQPPFNSRPSGSNGHPLLPSSSRTPFDTSSFNDIFSRYTTSNLTADDSQIEETRTASTSSSAQALSIHDPASLLTLVQPPSIHEVLTQAPQSSVVIDNVPAVASTSVSTSTSPSSHASKSLPPPSMHSASDLTAILPTHSLPISPPPRAPEPEPLHTYCCPICFSPPTNATLTPCGHILCGECLFTAVNAAVMRTGVGGLGARCPVCRATLPGWDGRGGGVIGLRARVMITL